jgi:hypothetical protein
MPESDCAAGFADRRRNTHGWQQKKRHVRRLLAHLALHYVRLAEFVLRKEDRVALSRSLFTSFPLVRR